MYIYDADKKTLQAVCDVEDLKDVPADVRELLYRLNLPVVKRGAWQEVWTYV
jgi:hypothetical protein